MSSIGTNYLQHNYYNPDLANNTQSVAQQETNIQNNTFSPLFASKQHCENFKRDINTEFLISYLYGKDIISEKQYNYLLIKNINYEKTNLLVDILTNKLLGSDLNEAINLVQALSDGICYGCNQHFLVATLNLDIDNFFKSGRLVSNMPSTPSVISGENNLNSVVISPLFANKENYEIFKEDVEIDRFISCIYGYSVISDEQHDELCVNLTRYQKVDLLVDMLNDKLIRATEAEASDLRKKLVYALCNECSQPFLVDLVN